MVVQHVLAGTDVLWFAGGIFFGANLGFLFAAIARMGNDWE
jgi:hypothetical protein